MVAQLPIQRLANAETLISSHAADTAKHAGGGGGGGTNYQTVQDEGGALTQQPILNFTGAGVTATNDGAGTRTTVNIPSASATTFPRPSLIVVYSNDFPSALKTTADATWTYQCDAVSDEVEINAAITQAALTRGDVKLMGFLFKQRAPILRKTGVSLSGLDFNTTRVEVDTTGWSGATQIALADVNTHATTVHDLWLDGKNIGLVDGIMGDNTAGNFTGSPSTSPDPSHLVYNIRAYNHSGHGIWSKANERGSKYHTIYVLGSTLEGVLFESPDCDISDVQIGSSGLTGFKMTGSNNRISHIKSWFSDLHGIWNAGVRNVWSAIEAQDNLGHGVEITVGKSSFVGVSCDSNSYDGSPSGAITGRTFHGIDVGAVGGVLIQGAMSYDKNEGSRGARQVRGIQVSASSDHCFFDVVTYGNFTGSVGGTLAGNGTNLGRVLSVDGL
jgi:hypothetical protein